MCRGWSDVLYCIECYANVTCLTSVSVVTRGRTAYPETTRDFFHITPAVLCPLVALWALAIGFSRVALGRHYPSDVLAGGVIGVLVIFPIAHFVIARVVSFPAAVGSN